MSNNVKYLTFAALFLCAGCHHKTTSQNDFKPQIHYSIQDKYIKALPTSFEALAASERKEEWGKEYTIGVAFARELDLYRAITAFKRCQILLPSEDYQRRQEVEYFTLLCYYLGGRYDEVVDTFETSDLKLIDSKFATYHDLLVILYESYRLTDEEKKALRILNVIQNHYPETAKTLALSSALSQGDLQKAQTVEVDPTTKKDVKEISSHFEKKKKSPTKARALNAFIPGAGYLYVGQKQSAFTSLSLNALFIAAAYHFFHKGEIAAAVITTSFEAGWYFGGIYGAGEAAKLYNERIYEDAAYQTLNRNQLFPVFMISYGF